MTRPGCGVSTCFVNTPERTTAAAFPPYTSGQILAESALVQWSWLFVRRYRFRRVVGVAHIKDFVWPARFDVNEIAEFVAHFSFDDVEDHHSKSTWMCAAFIYRLGFAAVYLANDSALFARLSLERGARTDRAGEVRYALPDLSPADARCDGINLLTRRERFCTLKSRKIVSPVTCSSEREEVTGKNLFLHASLGKIPRLYEINS